MKPRFRFEEFAVSPEERMVRRPGVEVPLVPRYFDLLVLLLEQRDQAVQREAILDAVWSDVVVSDGALSQAIRTLRRALGDAAREPIYIRTVSRHGYRFVHPGVVEEPEATPAARAAPAAGAVAAGAAAGAATPAAATMDPGPAAAATEGDRFEPLLRQLLGQANGSDDGEESSRREAAEALHALGTAEALSRLDLRPGHEKA